MSRDSIVRDLWIMGVSFVTGLAIGLKWDWIFEKLQYARSLFSDTGWN